MKSACALAWASVIVVPKRVPAVPAHRRRRRPGQEAVGGRNAGGLRREQTPGQHDGARTPRRARRSKARSPALAITPQLLVRRLRGRRFWRPRSGPARGAQKATKPLRACGPRRRYFEDHRVGVTDHARPASTGLPPRPEPARITGGLRRLRASSRPAGPRARSVTVLAVPAHDPPCARRTSVPQGWSASGRARIGRVRAIPWSPPTASSSATTASATEPAAGRASPAAGTRGRAPEQDARARRPPRAAPARQRVLGAVRQVGHESGADRRAPPTRSPRRTSSRRMPPGAVSASNDHQDHVGR